MKPAPFDYVRPATLPEAVEFLAREDISPRVINGGQSLMPMLNLRLAATDFLVDISKIPELTAIEETSDGHILIGAAVKHNALLSSSLIEEKLPLMKEAYTHVAHHSIRNRGTLGGSLCHADPAAEMPMVVDVLDATLIAMGASGTREIPASQFFYGAFDTALEEDEILTQIKIPIPPAGHGAHFQEISQRHGDFALIAVGCVVAMEGDLCTDVRVGFCGLGEGVYRFSEVEDILKGKPLSQNLVTEMGKKAQALAEPASDLHADEQYRRDLAVSLTRRVVTEACARCQANK